MALMAEKLADQTAEIEMLKHVNREMKEKLREKILQLKEMCVEVDKRNAQCKYLESQLIILQNTLINKKV